MRTALGHHYILAITGNLRKLVNTVPIHCVTTAEITKPFLNHYIVLYAPAHNLIAHNVHQFTFKRFWDDGNILDVDNPFTTNFYSQSNGQGGSSTRTLLSALRTYISDDPRYWDPYIAGLTYVYKYQPQTFIAITPFELALSNHPRMLEMQKKRPTRTEPIAFKQNGTSYLEKHCKTGLGRIEFKTTTNSKTAWSYFATPRKYSHYNTSSFEPKRKMTKTITTNQRQSLLFPTFSSLSITATRLLSSSTNTRQSKMCLIQLSLSSPINSHPTRLLKTKRSIHIVIEAT